MLLEADKIYQGTSQINQLGTGPGRPWCRYATVHYITLHYTNVYKPGMHAPAAVPGFFNSAKV